jgi:hypothetical protein
MANYRILFVGNLSDNIMSSTQMFSFGLIRELKKLNIDLVILNLNKCDFTSSVGIEMINAFGEVDFTLCHVLDSTDHTLLNVLKKITKYEVTVFVETPIYNYKFDRYFLYKEPSNYAINYSCYNAPILKDFYLNVEKEKNSILLDHRWQQYLGTNGEMSDSIIEWVKELSNEYKIYKLIKWDEKQKTPDYITPIPHTTFQEYIKLIRNKEIFISTHIGSYNSTVIDMLAFGAKCLIPKIDGRTYVPQYNVDLFNLPVFNTKEEMLSEIRKPLIQDMLSKQIDKCTNIVDIVADINKQFIEIKNNKNDKV